MTAAAAVVVGALSAGAVLVGASPRLGPLLRTGRDPRAHPQPTPRAGAPVLAAAVRAIVPTGRLRPADLAKVVGPVLVLAVIAPPLALLPAVVPVLRRHLGRRRHRRAMAREIATGLPDTVDLLLLCVGAGLSLPLAHPLVAAATSGQLGAALVAADRASVGGGVRADAVLAALVPLGDRAAALAHVLVDHLRYGVPLLPGLERLELELRLDRRRRAEEDARRVPLRLLAPLLTCVLPAFALLTVVPLLVASLRSLPR